jgi:hypothetical protein
VRKKLDMGNGGYCKKLKDEGWYCLVNTELNEVVRRNARLDIYSTCPPCKTSRMRSHEESASSYNSGYPPRRTSEERLW